MKTNSNPANWEQQLKMKLLTAPLNSDFDRRFWEKFESEFKPAKESSLWRVIVLKFDALFQIQGARWIAATLCFAIAASVTIQHFSKHGIGSGQFSTAELLQSPQPADDLDLMLAIQSQELSWADMEALAHD